MEELDLLKKDWKRRENEFRQYSEKEIYSMSHKKSASVVKWIFIVSLIELGLGILMAVVMSYTKYDQQNIEFIKEHGLYPYYITFSVLFYAAIIYFIVRFYSMFRKISVDDSTRFLLGNIIKTRKVVKQYIAFNLTVFVFIWIALGGYIIYTGYAQGLESNGSFVQIPFGAAIVSFVILIIITAIFTVIIWAIYKLIYGWLLKKLNRNYEELKKIDL